MEHLMINEEATDPKCATLPLTKVRKPPTRWLSAKKAFEERPIVLQHPANHIPDIINTDSYKQINISHFSETPV